MGAVALVDDVDVWILEYTEQRLEAWGNECWSTTERLGIPTVCSFAQIIDHVRRQERLRKGVRKKRLREARKQWKEGDPPIDAKLVAEGLGNADPDLTARGKQTTSPVPAKSIWNVDSRILQVDAVVSTLPGWMKKCVFRKYLYGQPDRLAADELRMPSGDYASRCRAAVERVAAGLQQRYSATVHRDRRMTPRGV